MVYMPANITNNNAQGTDNDVTKVSGKINLEDGVTPYEMAFVNGKIFLSGFATIYGFTPAVAATIPNGGVANNSNQKNIAINPNPEEIK